MWSILLFILGCCCFKDPIAGYHIGPYQLGHLHNEEKLFDPSDLKPRITIGDPLARVTYPGRITQWKVFVNVTKFPEEIPAVRFEVWRETIVDGTDYEVLVGRTEKLTFQTDGLHEINVKEENQIAVAEDDMIALRFWNGNPVTFVGKEESSSCEPYRWLHSEYLTDMELGNYYNFKKPPGDELWPCREYSLQLTIKPEIEGHSEIEECTNLTAKETKMGIFTSPEYPFYENNVEACWLIKVDAALSDFVVVLEVDEFNLEPEYDKCGDFLEVCDGTDRTAPLLNRWCGRDKPDPMKGTSSSMYVRFLSDRKVTNKGFKMNFYASSKTGNSIRPGTTTTRKPRVYTTMYPKEEDIDKGFPIWASVTITMAVIIVLVVLAVVLSFAYKGKFRTLKGGKGTLAYANVTRPYSSRPRTAGPPNDRPGTAVPPGGRPASTRPPSARPATSMRPREHSLDSVIVRPETSAGTRPGSSAGTRPGSSAGARPSSGGNRGARPKSGKPSRNSSVPNIQSPTSYGMDNPLYEDDIDNNEPDFLTTVKPIKNTLPPLGNPTRNPPELPNVENYSGNALGRRLPPLAGIGQSHGAL